MVWIGSLCGVVVDALPGTHQSDESSCECSDECVSVACEASAFESEEDEAPQVEEWELMIEAACYETEEP